ncbi:MAG: FtsX-like permease family protein, partial [Gemmatimonadales bacterium]
GFTLGVTLMTGLLFGAAPAFQSLRLILNDVLKEGWRAGKGPDRGRLRRILVVGEIAMALILLAGAGLLFESFVNLRSVLPGFDASHLAGVELRMEGERYDTPARIQFVRQLLARVRAIPGVRQTAVSISVPFQFYGRGRTGWSTRRFVNDLGAEVDRFAMVQPVSPGFFSTIGADLVGDDVSPGANGETPIPVALSQSLARDLFGERNPLGRVFQWGRTDEDEPRQLRVAGVVKGLHHWGLDQGDESMLYVPWERMGADIPMTALAVRTDGDPAGVLPALRAAIWELDPDMALPDVFTVPERMGQSLAAPKFYAALLMTFAAVALLLAAGGIYGAMLYTVGRRRHEFGIRAALGADGGTLVRHVLWSSARITIVGLGLGLAGALLATRALRSMLFQVSAGDPVPLLGVAALMGAVAIGASVIPARRAARANPVDAMRAE